MPNKDVQRTAAGRVLSARNERRLRDADSLLNEVLAELDDESEEASVPKKTIDPALLSQARNLAPTEMGPGVLRLAADKEESAELFIYGDIGGWWNGVQADQFAQDVSALDVETINVRLNSPGGLVFDGVAIYNALAMHKARVIVHIDGIAASIASIIAMAGDEIRIAEGAHVMIHKPWSFAMGDAEVMRKEAQVLDDLEAGLLDIYAARTGNDLDQLQTWLSAETWFRGQKAVDEGFADVMVPAKKKEKEKKEAHARSALLPRFRNAPGDVVDPCEPPADAREFERLLRDEAGFTNAQAKRIAVLARVMQTGPRDESRQPAPRDDGATQRLAAFLRSL